jgi:hypothetical protein
MPKPTPAPYIFGVAGKASNPALANPAVAHCCEAWQRTARSLAAEGEWEPGILKNAAAAYRSALPPLTGPESVSDFVACVAQAAIMKILRQNDVTQLLYAAQVAIGTVRREPKPPKSAAA